MSLTLLVLGLSACTVEHQIERRVQLDTFLLEPASEVDILWMVDSSRSMAEEQARLS